MKLKIKIMSTLIGEKIKPPFYATEGSAGMDLSACIDAPVTLKPMERALIPCGFAVAVPAGYVGLIYARSGLGMNHGITLPNCVGVVDSDYRGELKCAIINLGRVEYTIKQGDRIAQLVIAPVARCEIELTDSLDETGRGGGGFGSTGLE